MNDILTPQEEAAEQKYTQGLGMGWLLPLLLIVLAIGLYFYFAKSSNTFVAGNVQADSSLNKTTSGADSSKLNEARKEIRIELVDDNDITAFKDGIEDKLFLYIISTKPQDSISKSRWFDFDDLNFELNSAVVTDSSMRQVNNIVAILKAYPKVKIKIGGYTDKTGDEAANIKLSQARADAVVLALKEAGANPAQLTGAEGYGSKYAKAPANASDSTRRKDRRISVNVRAK